jgi:hypothetical protein
MKKKRLIDFLAGLTLFFCGSFVVATSVALWIGPLGGATTVWRDIVVIVVGATSALAAIGLFFSRRPAGFVGAISLFGLACYYTWRDPVMKDLFFPAVFAAVSVLVYWRFVRSRERTQT